MSLAVSRESRAISTSPLAWLTGPRALLFLACYFISQTLLRVIVSDSAELDESEQLLFSQVWRWGYGSDPPLYTWLQIAFFEVLGTSILALALLKNLLLFSTFAFTYLATKEISGNARTAAVAVLSLLLFPQITWESQRDLTHSVLATTLAAATFFVAARLPRHGGILGYALLGVCAGLGVLSKYSYSLVVLAVVVGGLIHPASRAIFLNRWILLSAGIVVLLTAPHFQWVMAMPEVAFRRPLEVIQSRHSNELTARWVGLVSVVKCAVMLSAGLAAVYWFAFFGRPRARLEKQLPDTGWIRNTLWIILAMALIGALIFGVRFKDRWFQPVVFLLAIYAAVLVSPSFDDRVCKRFFGVILVVAVITLILLPGIPYAAALTDRPTRLNAPFARLSAELQPVLKEAGAIVASTRLVGGNLRLHVPGQLVIAPEFPSLPLPADQPWLAVWDASRRPEPPTQLLSLLQRRRGAPIEAIQARYVTATSKYTSKKSMTLGYLLVSPRSFRP